MSVFKNKVTLHTSMVLSIVQVMPLLLLIAGCSGQDAKQTKTAQATALESSDRSNASVTDVRDDLGTVLITWAECSPEATAAFERLTSNHDGARRPAQVSKDLVVLTRDCDAGSLAVCNGLGIVYGEGHGVDPDLDKAVSLFHRACDGGLAMGCFNLALLHRSGSGVRKDLSEAARFLEKACGLENFIACQNVAVAYASGRGVPKDFGKAALFYEKACNGGWSAGCSNLAGLYRVGAGVEKDLEKAKEYYAKGCELGLKFACEASKRMR
jgi:TPR repeat protein